MLKLRTSGIFCLMFSLTFLQLSFIKALDIARGQWKIEVAAAINYYLITIMLPDLNQLTQCSAENLAMR